MKFRNVKIIGATTVRIAQEERNKAYFYYEVRDDGCGTAVSIHRAVWVNHWGTIITNQPITDWQDGTVYLDDEESELINEALASLRRI